MSFGQRNFDRQKPEIDFPEGDVPTELVVTDIIEGDGAEAKPGDTVSTHYVGVAWSAGWRSRPNSPTDPGEPAERSAPTKP